MYERYIAVSEGGGYGTWGSGSTLAKAKQRLRKAGGKTRGSLRVFRFTSQLPFAPVDRDAYKTEADCWVGQGDGSLNWIRCEREEIIGEVACTKPR